MPASPAFAISEVGCGNRDDFVKLDISFGNGMGTNKCFANGGVTGPNIGGVYNIYSGNNKATVNYERNGRYESTTLGTGRASASPAMSQKTLLGKIGEKSEYGPSLTVRPLE